MPELPASPRKSNVFSNIDLRIFLPAVCLILLLGVIFAIYETRSLDVLNSIFTVIIDNFTFGYIWYTVAITGLGFYLAFSKYGKVVLGDPREKPMFSLFEYACILTAMGIGSTVMRTGMMEWANVTINPPFGIEPLSQEALQLGNAYGMFLWSFQTFSIFVMSAPVMAYLLHVKKCPILRISEAFRCLIGDKAIDGAMGKIIDIFFLLSIVAGASVTLGLGAPIVTNILAKMLNISLSFQLTLVVTIVWALVLIFTAYFGLERGIKFISVLNVYVAAAVAIFIIVAGPTIFILDHFTDSIGSLIINFTKFVFNADSLRTEEAGYVQRYTIFWFAYNATWSLLHSIFAAKVSKGRTIKEMILTYYAAPMWLSWVATGLLGGLSIERYVTNQVPVLDIVRSEGMLAAIPDILATLPFPTIMMIAFMFLASLFLISTLNSTAYTIALYTNRQDMSQDEPSNFVHITMAILISAVALVLMRVGGLIPLETLSGLLGLPIIFIQFATVYAAIKLMNQDKAWIHNIRS